MIILALIAAVLLICFGGFCVLIALSSTPDPYEERVVYPYRFHAKRGQFVDVEA